MNRKKWNKIRRQLDACGKGQPKAAELVRLARALGRTKHNRGKEPTYESDDFPDLSPLTIPMHKGRDLATGTRDSILAQLDDDLTRWDETLTKREQANGQGNAI